SRRTNARNSFAVIDSLLLFRSLRSAWAATFSRWRSRDSSVAVYEWWFFFASNLPEANALPCGSANNLPQMEFRLSQGHSFYNTRCEKSGKFFQLVCGQVVESVPCGSGDPTRVTRRY